MRAIDPVMSGILDARGFRVAWEAFGDSSRPAILFLPPWQIVHSRIWKLQVSYLARRYFVVTIDCPGNGNAERTTDPRAFEYQRIVDQAIDVLDHLAISEASVVGFSRGCAYALLMAATYPDRVSSIVLIGGKVTPGHHERGIDGAWDVARPGFWERQAHYAGWEKYNAHYWRSDYAGWLDFFFNEIFPEAHSTKPIEDCVTWANQTDPEVLIASAVGEKFRLLPPIDASDAVKQIQCPALLIHGDCDRCSPIQKTRELAAARPDWRSVTIENAGHAPMVRYPVTVNLLLSEFFGDVSASQEEGARPHDLGIPHASS